jgi:hypothetical protein
MVRARPMQTTLLIVDDFLDNAIGEPEAALCRE